MLPACSANEGGRLRPVALVHLTRGPCGDKGLVWRRDVMQLAGFAACAVLAATLARLGILVGFWDGPL